MQDRPRHHNHPPHAAVSAPSLDRLAFSATVHCLIGCSIGEVLGMVIGTAAGLSNVATITLAVVLAFFFGYAMTVVPLYRAGLAWSRVLPLAFASDTASITVMEIVDNAIMLLIPGAMDAQLWEARFWLSLAVSLLIAGIAAYPVNRFLIMRGRGHALVHEHHRHHAHH
jgi:Domain of unknown function (DUF4396)